MLGQLFFKCGEEHDFAEVKEKLQSISGVATVAKLPGKGAEEGMAEVESQEAGEAVVAALEGLGAEYLSQPSNTEDAVKAKGAKKPKEDKTTKGFFDNFATLKDTLQRQKKEELAKHNKEMKEYNSGGNRRNNNNNSGNRQGRSQRGGNGGARQGSRSRSGGRGGRGGGGRGFRSNSGGRGRGGRGGRGGGRYNAPQYIQGHVASVYNVPESMTNDQIATVFDSCGTIFDVARYENMAMVYFDSQEAVTNAIMLVNGTHKMNGNLATVSDAGTLRVPIPRNLDLQALSPQFIHMHQQGTLPPLPNPAYAAAAQHLAQEGVAAPLEQKQ